MSTLSNRSATDAVVAGIDRWRKGWIIAISDNSGLRLVTAPTTTEAFAATELCAVVTVDMPIALPAHGTRSAELDLRAALGAAGRSVFISPTRAAIEAPNQNAATELNRANGGPGISAQAWGLAGSIRELRSTLPAWKHKDRWFETHPESAFATMNDGDPLASKKTARGVGQRLALLREVVPSIDRLLVLAPEKVPVDDVLDAIAACWSAARVDAGVERVVGEPGLDDQGFEQSIRI